MTKILLIILLLITFSFSHDAPSKGQLVAGYIMLGVGCGLVGGGAYSRYYANEIYNDDLNKPMTFEETHERTERTVGANILNFFSIPIMIAGTVIGTIGTVKTVKYYKKRKLDFSLRTETNYVKLDLVYKW